MELGLVFTIYKDLVFCCHSCEEEIHRSSMEPSSGDIQTSTSLAQVLGARLQDMWLVLMMFVCSWFSVHRDVTYYFIWDPGGGWSSLCCWIP